MTVVKEMALKSGFSHCPPSSTPTSTSDLQNGFHSKLPPQTHPGCPENARSHQGVATQPPYCPVSAVAMNELLLGMALGGLKGFGIKELKHMNRIVNWST